MSTYTFQYRGAFYEAPLASDLERGLCTGIPRCCIDYFVKVWPNVPHAEKEQRARHGINGKHWGYIPCPECISTGNRIKPRQCTKQKALCTCGAWSGRVRLKD